MTGDRPLLGILLMLGFCILAPLGDGMAKILTGTIAVGQILLIRFAVQGAILIPFARATRRPLSLSGRVLWLAWLRTALHIIGIGAMFTSLMFLPLADAIAIAFVMPFIMLLLGRFVLKEEVGARRLIACAIGFIGTLMVIQPSFADVGAPALLPLLVAVVFALFMLVTRQIAKETNPIALQAVNGAMGCAILIPVVLFGHLMEVPGLIWIAPGTREWALLLGIGVLGTLAHLLMTWSLRYAPSVTLAPMQYLEIPFATLIGWLFFRDLPGGFAAVGILITIGAGLYIILRERASARRLPAAPAPRRPAPPAV